MTPNLAALKTISSSHNYNQWIYRNIKNYLAGNILDIGSGIGNIAQFFDNKNIEKVTLSDPSPEMVPYLSEKFKSMGNYKVLKMGILDNNIHTIIPENSMNTITCLNVLEHIKNDAKALMNMNTILKKDGRLILIVPALQCLYGSLDSTVSHYKRYNKNSLNNVLRQSNFVIQQQYYMNIFGILTWFIAGKILKAKGFNQKMCKKLDTIVPTLETLEQFLPPPIGQSLVTICHKN